MLHNRAESLEEYDVRGIGALAEDVESHDSEPHRVSEQSRLYVIMMRCVAEELVAGACQLVRAADVVGARRGGRFHVAGDQLLRRCWINDSDVR